MSTYGSLYEYDKSVTFSSIHYMGTEFSMTNVVGDVIIWHGMQHLYYRWVKLILGHPISNRY